MYIIWISTFGLGSILGAFLTPPTVGWIVLALVVLTLVGSCTLAYLQLIQAEWLLLLIALPPAAGVMFVAAIISNVLIGLRKCSPTKSSASQPTK